MPVKKNPDVLRASQLLDNCQTCPKKPLLTRDNAEEVCGGCWVYQELRQLGERMSNNKGGKKMPEIRLEEYVSYKKEGLKRAQIAKKLAVEPSQLSSWMQYHKTAIAEAMGEEQPVTTSAPPKPKLKTDVEFKQQLENVSKVLGQKTDKPAVVTAAEVMSDVKKLKEDNEVLKKDYGKLKDAHENLSKDYKSLETDFKEKQDLLQQAQSRIIELDDEYRENYNLAKKKWDDQYKEMKAKFEAALDVKNKTIQELTIKAEEQAALDEELESLRSQLQQSETELSYQKMKASRANEQADQYYKELFPLRQLALVKLEAEVNAQV